LTDDRVQQVKQANDIVEVVGSYLALRPQGQTFKGLCPFHDDQRPSFDVDPHRQRYRCWSCGKVGDVISFVQEHEHIGFAEALELLARRAGIFWENDSSPRQASERARMLDVTRWAAGQYHQCFLEAPLAERARHYLGERGLKGETVRQYGLGFAPPTGDWLIGQARAARIPLDVLEAVGLIAPSNQGNGHYDRFRDRVLFPIKDVRGRVVGFGGRILPDSPLASRAPKYYNSSDTPLFTKSENLYGLDQARHAAARVGYLAVVEGYTDVLMAHQAGITQVVATLGTALNARHVRQLRRFVPRVVLVFDADAGGMTGVDRALEIFAAHDLDLAVAALPPGLDPCDLIVQQGPEAFQKVLDSAQEVLEFKLRQLMGEGEALGIEEQRRAVDGVLGIIARAPVLQGKAGIVKRELIVSRISQRLLLSQETVWARLHELRQQRRASPAVVPSPRPSPGNSPTPEPQEGGPAKPGRAAPEERELLEVLLADPGLVPRARAAVRPDEVDHPFARRLLEGLYALHNEGKPPTLDHLRDRLQDPALAAKALKLQERGQQNPDRGRWLDDLLACFEARRARPLTQELHHQLQAPANHAEAKELLRRLQNQNAELGPDAARADRTGESSPVTPPAARVSGHESRRV
jgi:DNA primase